MRNRQERKFDEQFERDASWHYDPTETAPRSAAAAKPSRSGNRRRERSVV